MRLYGYYRSSTSYRVRIGLNLKGLAFETVPVNIVKGEQREEPFRALNAFAGVPLLPPDIEDRFVARELAYAIATELHAPLNSPVLAYLDRDLGLTPDQVRAWYHHWTGKTLTGLEARLVQRGAGDFLFDAPGLFETVLVPQLYNARRFGFDLSAMPAMSRIEAACLALPEFEAAHPDNQPDAPEKP
jgi:maleylpyruvate isomerase